MCNIIVINRGEIEIGTPRQFLEYFGFTPYDATDMDYCLCQCDIEQTLIDNNILFKKACGDIYIGMLDDIKGDDD
jgi:hypothetical protein